MKALFRGLFAIERLCGYTRFAYCTWIGLGRCSRERNRGRRNIVLLIQTAQYVTMRLINFQLVYAFGAFLPFRFLGLGIRFASIWLSAIFMPFLLVVLSSVFLLFGACGKTV